MQLHTKKRKRFNKRNRHGDNAKKGLKIILRYGRYTESGIIREKLFSADDENFLTLEYRQDLSAFCRSQSSAVNSIRGSAVTEAETENERKEYAAGHSEDTERDFQS